MITIVSAYVSVVLISIIIIFQICLACGVPWGSASLGGKYPLKMRFVALLNCLILVFLGIIILSRSGLAFPSIFHISKVAIWFIVVFFIGGTIINTITPSKIERIWAPVNLLLLIATIIIAFN